MMVYKIRLLWIFDIKSVSQICFAHQVGGAFDFDDMHLEVDQAGMTNSINGKFEHFEFGKYNTGLSEMVSNCRISFFVAKYIISGKLKIKNVN